MGNQVYNNKGSGIRIINSENLEISGNVVPTNELQIHTILAGSKVRNNITY
jgi:parallel beta-helix repeat protein